LAYTKLQIVKQALQLIGKRPISSQADGGELADTAFEWFDTLLQASVGQYDWRFATKVVQLSKLAGTPIITRFTLIYATPADLESLRNVTDVSGTPTLEFQIFEGTQIFAIQDPLFAEYRFVPDSSKLPGYFVNYFSHELGAVLANTSGYSETVSELLQNRARSLLSLALAADAQQHPNIPIISSPFIENRSF